MRFLNTIFVALIAITLCGCADEIVSKELFTYDLQISATFSEEELARAEFDPSDLRKVAWQAGDKIDVFVVDAAGVYATGSLTTQDSGEKAYFTGPVTASQALTPPFSITATYGAEVLSTAVQGGYAQFSLGALKPLMVAQDEGPIYFVNRIALSFNQVASAIHMRDLPSGITKVTIESLGDMKMAGVYGYNIQSGSGSGNSNIADVDVKNGSAHIGLAPGNYSDGFKVKFWNESGELQYIKLPQLQVEKGHSYNISPISEFVPIKLELSSAEAYHIDASGSRSTGGATSDVAQSSIAWGSVEFLGAPASMIEEMGIRVYDSSNNIVYTTSGTSFTSKEYGAGAHNWASYKSHGTKYTVKAFATVEGETYESAGTTVSYVRPAIIVTNPQDCYTSYSKYLTSGATEANKCNGSSVYLVGNCTYKGVTAEVFSQMNGSAFLKVDGGSAKHISSVSGQSFTNNSAEVKDLSWATHTIQSGVDFDGTTFVSAGSQSLIVTGLPYYANPPTNTGTHSWTELSVSGTINWNSDNVSLQGTSAVKYPCVATPYFNIPSNINVNLAFKATRNNPAMEWATNSYLHLRLSPLDASNNVGDHFYNERLTKGSTVTKSGVNAYLSSTYNRIRVYYNYGSTGPVTYFYYLNIEYR
ncbi:MAG: hypothetical protein IKC67_03765 [Odoribacter sp.]|nr:hypothetical protein [Odoribacter sp.]